MARTVRPSWALIHSIATWFLIGLFSCFAVAHVVLTVLYAVGAWDTGVGYVLDQELPAWLITLIDGVAAWSLWTGSRRGTDEPWRGVVLTSLAAALMLARASWLVLVPVAVVLTLAGSIARLVASGRVAETRV